MAIAARLPCIEGPFFRDPLTAPGPGAILGLMRMSPQRTWTLAFAGALQPAWLLGGSIAFGALRPGYDATRAISELGEQGYALAVAWNVVGFGGAALLYGLYAVAVGAVFGRGWLFWLTAAQAVTIAGGGLFSCDPGCPPVMSTPQGWLHAAFGLPYFAVTSALPLVAWRVFRSLPDWRPLAPVSLAAGLLLVLLFVAGPFVFGAERVGLYQRTALALAGVWAAAVALRLSERLRQHNAPPQAAPSTTPL